MANLANSMVDVVQNQLEASRQFADAIFSGTERMDRVVIEATHHAFNEQLRYAQALASARDPNTVASLQTTFLSRPDNAVNYQKDLIDIFTEMQSNIGKSVQQYVEKMSSSAAARVTEATAATGAAGRTTDFNRPFSAISSPVEMVNPLGGVNPMAGMISAWQSAFREVASMANKNMERARNSFESAASAATSAASNSVSQSADAVESAVNAGAESAGRAASAVKKAGSSRRK